MPLYDTHDASFFSAVHHMIERKRTEDPNRRAGERHGFQCMQLIAPIVDGKMPDQSLFRRVQCLDLSQSGFSFLAPEPPNYENLVVALGSVPFTFLSAEVMHHKPILQGGATEYLVGCRFTGRMSN